MRYFVLQDARRAAVGCLVVLAMVAPSLGRKWHTADKLLRFEAELVAFDGTTVTLKMGGKNAPIPLDRLSDEDKQYLKTNYPNGLKDTSPKETKKAETPAADAPMPDEPTTADPAAAPPAKAAPDKLATATKSPSKSKSKAAPGPAKAGSVSVEVVSLTVTKPSKNDDQSGLLSPGTKFILLVTDPTRTITGLDSEKSKITACMDDQRKNLAKPAAGETLAPAMLMLQVQGDGHSGTLDLTQPQAPSPKATRILIRGELHVICGEGENAETVKVPLDIIVGLGL